VATAVFAPRRVSEQGRLQTILDNSREPRILRGLVPVAVPSQANCSARLQDIQSVPSPDREMIILWIGMGGWPLHYDGFPQVEVMAAAKHLGRDRVLACSAANRQAQILISSPSIQVAARRPVLRHE